MANYSVPAPEADFDASVARAAERIEGLRAQMADALSAWLDATAAWTAAFWKRSLAETVEEDPDAVVALSDEALRASKDDATSLIADARPHLQRRLVDDRPEDWPHLKPQTDPHDPSFRPQGTTAPFHARAATLTGVPGFVPEAVDGRLHGVLGDMAATVAAHGLVLAGFEHGDPFGHTGQWHANPNQTPPWSSEMIDAMAAYGKLHDDYVAALKTMEELESERKHAEATELWNSA